MLALLRKPALQLVAAVVALVIGAKIAIPMVPVPMTLQSLAVVLIGLHVGTRTGVAAVASYLILGACGLPVFAQGAAGIGTLTGDSAGYLWAFLPTVVLLSLATRGGFIVRRKQRFFAGLVAHLCILCVGTIWLAAYIGVGEAVRYGLLPFVPGALLKSAIASY